MEGFPNINNKLVVLLNDTKMATIGDKLFRKEEWPIILGYKSAGDKLVKSMEGLDKSTEVYPAIFLYRQFIELFIKYIYKYYIARDMEEYNKFIKDVQHDLLKSFNKILPIITEYYIEQNNNGNNEDILEASRQYVIELSKLDSNGFNFRYATGKDGIIIHPKEINIDLTNMKERIKELANFFSDVEENILNTKELEKEMEMEITRSFYQ